MINRIGKIDLQFINIIIIRNNTMKIITMQVLKGFMHNQKKIIYSIYMKIKFNFKNKLGRKFKVGLIEQISITIFKLKYNLPDRVLEDIFKIDHVTINRIINRISLYISKFNLNSKLDNEFYNISLNKQQWIDH